MKRTNIYLTEKQEEHLDYLAEILDCKSRSEIVRMAIENFADKYKEDIDLFTTNLIDEESDTLVTSKELQLIRAYEVNPKLFIDSEIKINTCDDGIIPFKLWEFQKDVIDDIHERNFNIINKSRRCGITNLIAADIVHYSIFNSDKAVVVMSNKLSQSIEILRIIKFMIEQLPEFIKPKINENNKSALSFENGTRIMAVGMGASSVRGYSINYMYADEAAFSARGYFDEFMMSVYPTIASGKNTRFIISSSPNGLNAFYAMWASAIANCNDLYPIKLPWNLVPGRDEKWVEETKRAIGEDAFSSQFECKFVNDKSYAL